MIVSLLNLTLPILLNDSAQPWQIAFQDGGSPSFEGIVELHDQILFYLIVILLGVGWVLSSTIRKFNRYNNPIVAKYHNHGLKEGLFTNKFNSKLFQKHYSTISNSNNSIGSIDPII